ncbi:MAG: hypothetical protein IPG99_15085 [Ignavibacteria bacterium]|nr:hypothetical protein [Ignavibacteria bacterium]
MNVFAINEDHFFTAVGVEDYSRRIIFIPDATLNLKINEISSPSVFLVEIESVMEFGNGFKLSVSAAPFLGPILS